MNQTTAKTKPNEGISFDPKGHMIHFSIDFTNKIYPKLAEADKNENFFFSPFSLQVLLAMLSTGASHETRKSLLNLIGGPADSEQQSQLIATIFTRLQKGIGNGFELVNANGMWVHKGFHLNPGFQERIAEHFDGTAFQVDFRNQLDPAIRTINDWAQQKTNGRIPQIVNKQDVTKETMVVLANAIYFKAKWSVSLSEKGTKNLPWHGPNGIQNIPTMFDRDVYQYFETSGYQAIRIGYKWYEFEMIVVLSKEAISIHDLENRIATENLIQNVVDGLTEKAMVSLWLPKFQIQSQLECNDSLKALGCSLPFSEQADFGEMGSPSISISKILQKTYIEVNEKGTEASAVTMAIGPMMHGVIKHEPMPEKTFRANRPFLFFIRHNTTNSIVFAGRVMDP